MRRLFNGGGISSTDIVNLLPDSYFKRNVRFTYLAPYNHKIGFNNKRHTLNLEGKIARIDSEIQNGLKFKAADRLRNLINQYPNEAILWNKLAELYYESGFLASAGRYWILTDPTDDRIKRSVAVYEKSVNYSGTKILQDITFRGDNAQLSEFGRRKLKELELDSKKKSNYIPKFQPILNKKKQDRGKSGETLKDTLLKVVFFAIIIMILASLVVGFITILIWIF